MTRDELHGALDSVTVVDARGTLRQTWLGVIRPEQKFGAAACLSQAATPQRRQRDPSA
jgi:hypothetical protein